MQLVLNLDLEGLEQAVGDLLPRGIRPLRLVLDDRRFRLEGEAPILGRVTLVAKVAAREGRLTLSGLDLEGAGLGRALALGKLHEAVERLDTRAGPFRAWGEPGGGRIHLAWS